MQDKNKNTKNSLTEMSVISIAYETLKWYMTNWPATGAFQTQRQSRAKLVHLMQI